MLALACFLYPSFSRRKNSNENPSSLMRRNFHGISSSQLCALSVAHFNRLL
jgi:hypothetical protein